MKYIITKHAKQRRPHHPIREDEFLISWMDIFNKEFDFATFEVGSTYKITSKGASAIIKKEKTNIVILITFRGFGTLPENHQGNTIQLKCRKVESRDAIKFTVYRINFKGKKVKCGRIYKNTQTKEKFRLDLKKNLINKYSNLPYNGVVYFNDFSEIENLISKNRDGDIFLNDFPRKNQTVLVKSIEIDNKKLVNKDCLFTKGDTCNKGCSFVQEVNEALKTVPVKKRVFPPIVQQFFNDLGVKYKK